MVGYINNDVKIKSDEPLHPYIRGEKGTLDLVSANITDIVSDNAHTIFDTDEVKEAIDGTAVLIQTITTDNETLSYAIDNIDYRQILIKSNTVKPSTGNIAATIKFNNISIDSFNIFTTATGLYSYFTTIRFGDMYIPLHLTGTSYANLTTLVSSPMTNRIRSVNAISINLNSADTGTHTIEIWGVK